MDDKYKLKSLTLRHGTMGILEDNKPLSYYNPNSRPMTLLITFRVDGGAQQQEPFILAKNPVYRERKINKKKFNNMNFSNEACCISLQKNENNVKMSCGHTINSNSMFDYLRTITNRNSWEYKIICPVPKCNTEWPFETCSNIACLNDEEYMVFDEEFQRRAAPEMKNCPSCDNLCIRPDDLRYYRVSCSACKKFDWCWECGQMWKGGGFTVCGNIDCSTDDINTFLQNAEETIVSGNIKVPAIRACPKCYALTCHNSACKHMKCKECGQDFCFVCLKLMVNNKWQCSTGDNSGTNCGIAPKQVVK